LPAKFAGPATPNRQLQRYLEGLTARVGGPEAVVDRPRYYVATATFRAMIIMHHTLLRIAPNVRILLNPLPSSISCWQTFPCYLLIAE
jgi:hypothetical protein